MKKTFEKILMLGLMGIFAAPFAKAQDQMKYIPGIISKDSIINIIDSLETAYQNNPSDDELKRKLSDSYVKLQMTHSSTIEGNIGIMFLTRALELDPENLIALYHRGELYVALSGDGQTMNARAAYLDLAVKDHEAAVNIDPKIIESWRHLSSIHMIIAPAYKLEDKKMHYQLALEGIDKMDELLKEREMDEIVASYSGAIVSEYVQNNIMDKIQIYFSLAAYDKKEYEEVVRQCQKFEAHVKEYGIGFMAISFIADKYFIALVQTGRKSEAEKKYKEFIDIGALPKGYTKYF